MIESKKVLVTGAGGLIGSAVVKYYLRQGYENILGIDNNSRMEFFGKGGDTTKSVEALSQRSQFKNFPIDIADREAVMGFFRKNGPFGLVVHTAAQPSHDLAAKIPLRDWDVNANGTFNMLEAFRRFSPEGTVVVLSTNKVYGDNPNKVPMVEKETRWDFDLSKPARGISTEGVTEDMSLDHTTHSLFGVSKAAADLAVQEYGRYFKLNTGVFRGGCLTGPKHSGAVLHGFLAYLIKAIKQGITYQIYGYKGKQVRDNIHAYDLVNAFYHFYQNPRCGEVYNIGGSRFSNCSMLEAINLCEEICGKKLNYEYVDQNRAGDHIWWISNVSKFKLHYPEWDFKYDIKAILQEIYDVQKTVV